MRWIFLVDKFLLIDFLTCSLGTIRGIQQVARLFYEAFLYSILYACYIVHVHTQFSNKHRVRDSVTSTVFGQLAFWELIKYYVSGPLTLFEFIFNPPKSYLSKPNPKTLHNQYRKLSNEEQYQPTSSDLLEQKISKNKTRSDIKRKKAAGLLSWSVTICFDKSFTWDTRKQPMTSVPHQLSSPRRRNTNISAFATWPSPFMIRHGRKISDWQSTAVTVLSGYVVHFYMI